MPLDGGDVVVVVAGVVSVAVDDFPRAVADTAVVVEVAFVLAMTKATAIAVSYLQANSLHALAVLIR